MQTKQDMLEAAVQVGEFLGGGKIGTIIFSELITEYWNLNSRNYLVWSSPIIIVFQFCGVCWSITSPSNRESHPANISFFFPGSSSYYNRVKVSGFQILVEWIREMGNRDITGLVHKFCVSCVLCINSFVLNTKYIVWKAVYYRHLASIQRAFGKSISFVTFHDFARCMEMKSRQLCMWGIVLSVDRNICVRSMQRETTLSVYSRGISFTFDVEQYLASIKIYWWDFVASFKALYYFYAKILHLFYRRKKI